MIGIKGKGMLDIKGGYVRYKEGGMLDTKGGYVRYKVGVC